VTDEVCERLTSAHDDSEAVDVDPQDVDIAQGT
jgi:hypothetical protein